MSTTTEVKKAVTPVTAETKAPTKYVVAQSTFVADALKRKVISFKDAEVIIGYPKDLRKKLLGAEVLGTQMDVSLAEVAQVFHQCTLPKNKDDVEAMAAMSASNPQAAQVMIDGALWDPKTYKVESESYYKWQLAAMQEATQPKLELEA